MKRVHIPRRHGYSQEGPLYHDGLGIFFDGPPMSRWERRVYAWGVRALWFGLGLCVGAVVLLRWGVLG